MKIAFINPPGPRFLYRGSICTYLSKASYVWKPKDFILLSGAVPPEWEIVFMDASLNQISVEKSLEWIKEQRADVLVMALSSIAWRNDFSVLQKTRARFPDAKLFVFGEVFLEPTLAQEARKYADGIIYDPLLSNLPAMVATGSEPAYPHRVHGGPKTTREIQIHIPRHALFENSKYYWPFIKHFRFASVYTQFGCPFTCSYCSESITNVTYRPAENVLEEMRSLRSQGYKELLIGDASFGYPRQNALKIMEGMVREEFGFSWSSYVHPGLADADTIGLMARSGCHTAVIGIDSADGTLLEKYGRKLPLLGIKDFIENCHKNGIEVCGDIILGFKEDTRESCMRTIQLTIDLGIDYTSVNIATPLMGSTIREEYKSSGQIGQSQTGFDTAGLNAVMDTRTISAKDLVWLQNQAVKQFYLRPSYIWKHLRGLSSFEEMFVKVNEGMGIIINWLKQELKLRLGPR